MIALSDLLQISGQFGSNTLYCALTRSGHVVISARQDMATVELILEIDVIDLLIEAGHLLIDRQRLRASRYPIDSDFPIEEQRVSLILTERVGHDYVNISFLMANPGDQPKLELTREVELIRDHLRTIGATHRARLAVINKVSVERLPSLIIDGVPKILHFSGHGEVDGGVILEYSNGASTVVSISLIQSILSEAGDSVFGVFLNCCYSSKIVKDILCYVDWAIGMEEAVPDDLAIEFARAFYGSFVLTGSAQSAFNISCAAINNGTDLKAPAVFFSSQ